MTPKQEAALRLAREALANSLDSVANAYYNDWRHGIPTRKAQLDGLKQDLEKHESALAAIDEALAEQPAQEPVAWMFEFPDKRVKPKFDSAPHGGNWQPLYIHPQPDAYGYAKRLAEAIWKKHYQSTAPQWEPFDDLMGVLTQIDNMTAGLTTPPAAPVQQDQFADSRNMVAAPVQEPVAWAVHYKGPIPLFTKTKSEAEAWGGNKIVPLYTTPPTVPVQETSGCQHKRYSVDVHEQTGTCYDCGAEGRMRFVVGDATSPTAPVQEK